MRKYRLFEAVVFVLLTGVFLFPGTESQGSMKLSGSEVMSCAKNTASACVPHFLLAAAKTVCKEERKRCFNQCDTMVPGYKDLCVLTCKEDYKKCRKE